MDLKISWNAMPAGQKWTCVRIYERIAGALNWDSKVAEVPMPAVSVTITAIPTVAHTYFVRSFDGKLESVDSNTVTVGIPVPTPVPVPPIAPAGLRVIAVVMGVDT